MISLVITWGKDEGVKELKEAAGIAMEYLEKDEGKFLEEWEVVYGADNYKLVTDYLDFIQSIFDPDSKEKPYPDRNELKDMKRNQKLIKLSFTVADGVLSIMSNCIASKVKGPQSITGKIALRFSKTALRDLLKQTDSLPLQLIGAVLLNTDKIEPKMLISILRYSASPISKYLQDELDYDVDETIKKLQENTLIDAEEKKLKEDIIEAIEEYTDSLDMELIQSLSLDDTGFRVLVLRKGNDVVISYNGETPDSNKLLPDEFYNLHIVYDLIKHKDFYNENTKITFTGYESGADSRDGEELELYPKLETVKFCDL